MTMTFEDLKRAKCELEIDLSRAVSDRLRRFSEQCGMVPDAIRVEIRSVQPVGITPSSFLDCSVLAELSI